MIAPCLHIRFRILHDRKQTTVLFCIAVCDTYAVGVDHTNLFYILLNLFFFKFKKIKRDLSGAYELKELKVSSAFSSSSQHQIMSTLQVMVNFITFQKAIHGLALSDDICIALKKRCLCNVADVYTKRSIVRCDRLDDRPYKSSLQIIVEFLTFEHSIRALAASDGLSVVDKWKESVIPNTSVKKALMFHNEYYDNDLRDQCKLT
jgi:hypothetical protein